MATRLYFDPVGLPTISPAFGAGWEQSGAALRRNMFLGQNKSGAGAVTFSDSETNASNTFDVLLVQAISPPLKAQTLTGTVQGQMRWAESDIAANFFNNVLIRVFSGDGATERGVILDHTLGATELVLTTLTNRNTPVSTALTDLACSEGDVIVVELGFRATNAVATLYTGSLSLMSGDLTPTDLAVDEATTTNNNSWIEFSADNIFLFGGSAISAVDDPMDTVAVATGTANANATLTLPAVPGAKHAIKSLQIGRSATAALAGNATLTITSTNLPGLPSWAVGNVMVAGGTTKDVNLDFGTRPLMSSSPGTPTVISMPAPGAAVLWNARAVYSLMRVL